MAKTIYDLVVQKENRLMLEQILDFSFLIRQGINEASKINNSIIKKCDVSIDTIHWYGMGASALVGEYLKYYLQYSSEQGPSIIVNRNHKLGHRDGSLYVFYSYSGNTKETIMAFRKAVEEIPKERIITFSSGGIMKEIAEKNGILNIRLPEGYVSRSHLPFGIGASVAVLANIFKLRDMLEDLKKVADEIEKKYMGEYTNNGQMINSIALRLSKRIAIILTDYTLKPVAMRFMAQLNENSKHFSAYFEVPEGCHNFIVGMRNIWKKSFIIIVRRESEDSFISKTMDILEGMLSRVDSLKFVIKDGGKYSWITLLKPTLFIDILSVFTADIKGENAFDIAEIRAIKESYGG